MTGAPVRLPVAPKIRAASMDALNDMLRSMRLSGGIFLDAEFTAPWCVIAKVGPEDCSPFVPQPRTIIAYHYVTVGRLLLQVGDQPPMSVEAGEIVVLPRNEEHRLGSSLKIRPVNADRLIQPAADGGLARIAHGGGGERTALMCGFLGSDAPGEPLTWLLPAVIKHSLAEGAAAQWVESSFRFAANELSVDGVRSPAVLGRLAELLFAEAVRRYVQSLPADEQGWIGGLRDPVVVRALGLLHGGVDRRWTTEALARKVGLSRSAFAERFTAVMGVPPMHYLANWRLRSAARRLLESHEPIARIAYAAGYESEAAFNRAFKRTFGAPPAAWRRDRRRPAEGEEPSGRPIA